MIQEVIITTQDVNGTPHIAPMGVHVEGDEFIILPFRPSTTLDNILATETAVMSYCDDVRIFAGCLTGRKQWALTPCQTLKGSYIASALAHRELSVQRIEEDETRPKLFCQSVYQANHAAFQGFNRAQYAVIEAAILVSRLHMLPLDKIQAEIDYLRIGLEKTAGANELEAWGWLMAKVEEYQQEQG